MTIVYAAYSKSKRDFFIGTDDLESFSKQKVSKLRYVSERYIVAIAGCDNPINALDGIVAQNKFADLANEYADAQGLATRIAEWTRLYTEAQVKEYSGDPTTAALLEKAEEQEPTLIIFDTIEFELFECDFGRIFPPSDFDPGHVKAVRLDEDVLHLFALARNRVGGKPMIALPPNFFVDWDNQFENLLAIDRAFHDKERAIQGPDKVPEIGARGSFCVFNSKGLDFRNVLAFGWESKINAFCSNGTVSKGLKSWILNKGKEIIPGTYGSTALQVKIDQYLIANKPLANRCYGNAWELARAVPGINYVEGILIAKFDHQIQTVTHAWNEFEGTHFDITPLVANHPDWGSLVSTRHLHFFSVDSNDVATLDKCNQSRKTETFAETKVQ